MRLPRDLSGSDLAQALRKFGYSITRQAGSHIRLSTYKPVSIVSRFRNIRPFASAHFQPFLPM